MGEEGSDWKVRMSQVEGIFLMASLVVILERNSWRTDKLVLSLCLQKPLQPCPWFGQTDPRTNLVNTEPSLLRWTHRPGLSMDMLPVPYQEYLVVQVCETCFLKADTYPLFVATSPGKHSILSQQEQLPGACRRGLSHSRHLSGYSLNPSCSCCRTRGSSTGDK